jgi:UbiD family decarboxylase
MAYYRDLREYIQTLEREGKLQRIHAEVNKDTELHPLVRWQFCGLEEPQRRAFLFENVTDSRGRRYSNPVLVAGLAATKEIYALGMKCAAREITERWSKAQLHPIPPLVVESGPVQEEIHHSDEIQISGFDEFPIPISTPGYDNAPYLTAAHWITRDPQTGIRNMGNYRGQVKATDRLGIYCVSPDTHLARHWNKCREMGRPLEAALVIGAVPAVSYAAVAKVPYGDDELSVAGGIAGEPIELVRCRTVDLEVPATAEIVIEGVLPTDFMEPEGPFGEAHGYMAARSWAPCFIARCITHRRNPVWVSFLSQFTPSESSKMKQVARENIVYKRVRYDESIEELKEVGLIERANSGRWCVLRMAQGTARERVWRALEAAADEGKGFALKIVVAVDEDIDPYNTELVVWAMSAAIRPHQDLRIVTKQANVHDYASVAPGERGALAPVISPVAKTHQASTLLVNGMRRGLYPPISLSPKPYMERAKRLWEELALPALQPRTPWHGYSLGLWTDRDLEEAEAAVQGRYYETGKKLEYERKNPAELTVESESQQTQDARDGFGRMRSSNSN